MAIIQVMDPILSNKIAAGEVVERPASIVKELVENALDAQSTSITIQLEEAGLHSIRVVDNGIGMVSEDAELAFERHATSKIKNEYDLSRIRTLGFRGEALASIASVSKIELWTATEEEGTHLRLEGGEIVVKEKAALRRGTDFTVSQLFYNTPARLKHMKSIQTELSHCIDLTNRLAFAHPAVAFHLTHNGKTIVRTPGTGDVLRVIAAVYGHEVAGKMIPFREETFDFTITGYVALPEVTRASKNYMTIFVNDRWIRNYVMEKAILEGLHTFLPIHRYPIIVLSIQTDPQLVDVNVHPSKKEVRLSKEAVLYRLVETTVREAIRQKVTIPTVSEEKEEKTRSSTYESSKQMSWQPPVTPTTTQRNIRQEQKEVQPTMPIEEVPIVQEQSKPFKVLEKSTSNDRHPLFPYLEIVGQVHGTYIIAQNEDGMYMIDQHAAQERINYEKYRDAFGAVTSEERQMMLIPLLFHYAKDEEVILRERLPLLQSVGIELEPFGPGTYAVKEYPAWFPKGEIRETIEQIVEQAMTENEINIEKIREESAILMSCKRSIKANHTLTKADMERLIYDLSRAEHPYTCPHGRPVIIHYSTTDIEKMFKRIMS